MDNVAGVASQRRGAAAALPILHLGGLGGAVLLARHLVNSANGGAR